MSVANDASESPETRESIPVAEPATQQHMELDALETIVQIQAEAINAMIISLSTRSITHNNLQQRVAALEKIEHVKAAKSNGHGIIRIN